MKPSCTIGEHTLPSSLIRLHVSLDWVGKEEAKILQEYGCVKRGNTITRDILVPQTMPLRSLHFTLQRAFGFQDSHLHRFDLFAEDLAGITDGKMENLLALRGIIFTYDQEDGPDPYEPTYSGGRFSKWLKRQYTAPFSYKGDSLREFHQRDPADGQKSKGRGLLRTKITADSEFYLLTSLHKGPDWSEALPLDQLKGHQGEGDCVKWVQDEDGWGRHIERCPSGDPEAMQVQRLRMGDLKIPDDLWVLSRLEDSPKVIERLRIRDVLALSGDYLPFDERANLIHTLTGLKHPQTISPDQIQEALRAQKAIQPKPFAQMLRYTYDYGDSWQFRISGSKGCSDLVEEGVISKEDLAQASEKALRERHPVLIARDGDMLFEDCGNVPGFVSFLEHVRLSPDEVVEEQEDLGYGDSWEEEEYDDEEEVDENGMTRKEALGWAVSQGWHRNDTDDIDLL